MDGAELGGAGKADQSDFVPANFFGCKGRAPRVGHATLAGEHINLGHRDFPSLSIWGLIPECEIEHT